jgi:hypothetical protein
LGASWKTAREQDIPRLNAELTKGGQAAVDPGAASPTQPEGSGDGDDEP